MQVADFLDMIRRRLDSANSRNERQQCREALREHAQRIEELNLRVAELTGALDELRGKLMTTQEAADKARSRELAGPIKRTLAMLTPLEIEGGSFARLGCEGDGGYVMLADLLTGATAYSFGIGDDVSWDAAMAERGFQVLQYDHTVPGPPIEHPNFRFSRLGLGAPGIHDPQLSTLDEILEANDHLGKLSAAVLKIDIEGSEWAALASASTRALSCFSQIIVEFHDLNRLSDNVFRDQADDALTQITRFFVPVHVHANNWLDTVVLGGVSLPTVLEVTFVKRDLVTARPGKRTYPTHLDRPNNPDRSEIFLDTFQFPSAS